MRSWYVAFFQIPHLAEWGWRTVMPRTFPRYLQRAEGVSADIQPAPTLATDGANGVQLYRQNVRHRLASPRPRRTQVPVQLIVPRHDRFVTPALLDDTGRYVTELHRRDVDGGHWLPVVEPEQVAGWIAEHAHRFD